MAKKKTTLNQSFWKDPAKESVQETISHWLRYLNFRDLEKYYKWCDKHSFPKTLSKSRYILEEEKRLRSEELAAEEEERANRSKQLVSKDERVRKLSELIDSEISKNEFLQKSWAEVKGLRRSSVYSSLPYQTNNYSDHNFLLNAYYRLIHYQDLFSKPLSMLKIKKSNPLAYFEEVVNQTVVKYPVPKCFLSWWFKPLPSWARAYVDLAQGKKVYEVFKDIEPVPLTHKQIFHLMNKSGKNTSSYEKARLQAILFTLKAPYRLEAALVRSSIFLEELNNQFNLKKEFLQFLIKNADFFDWNRTLDLWDYILYLKDLTPATPFSFKQRNLSTLIEGMLEWHANLGKSKSASSDKRVWDKSGISDYVYANEKTTEELTIRELTSGREIHAEGKVMHHCVYSYAPRCLNGQCAIFSMKHKANSKSDWKNAGTIEINLRTGEIVQFKAKYNAKPEATEEFHLRKWAERENLRVR